MEVSSIDDVGIDDVLSILYVVDMGALLYIMTLQDSSVVAVLCDCMF